MKKTVMIALCLLLVLSVTTNSLFAAGGREAKDDRILIGGSIFTLQYAWFLGAQIGMEQWAADNPQANVRFQFEDAMQDVQTNIQVLENLATAGAKGIVVFPTSSTAIIPTMVNLHNNYGIQFVVGDYAQEPQSEEDIVWETFVGHDMVALGEVSGQIAVDYLKKSGNQNPTLLYISLPTSGEVSAARLNGFSRVVRESFPNARIIVEGDTGGGDRNSAQSLMENILQREPKIDVVAGHNDAEVIGAYNAAVGAGRADSMRFIGIGGDKEVMRYLAEGNKSWLGEVLQDPVVLGYTAMEALWAAMQGADLPPTYELPQPQAITQENIHETGWETWEWL